MSEHHLSALHADIPLLALALGIDGHVTAVYQARVAKAAVDVLVPELTLVCTGVLQRHTVKTTL